MTAARDPIDQRYRGPATPAGMPTVLVSVEDEAELLVPHFALDDGPGAVVLPEHLWRRYQGDRAALDNTEARILAYAERWRREQEALAEDFNAAQLGHPAAGACQLCGRPGGYPACDTPVAGARLPCSTLVGTR